MVHQQGQGQLRAHAIGDRGKGEAAHHLQGEERMVAAVGDGAGPWGHSLGFELQGFFSFRNHKSILVCIRACDFWSGFVSCSLLSVRARLGSAQSCEFGPAPPPRPHCVTTATRNAEHHSQVLESVLESQPPSVCTC